MIVYLYLVIGVLTRVLLPWLVKLRTSEDKIDWQWKFLRGQLIGALMVFLLLPLLIPGYHEAIESWDAASAWSAGYAVADLGRMIDKAFVGHVNS